MKSSIEVILCTYNGSAFITEQLSSILKQTLTVSKISIYDDCSTDHTLEVIRNFIETLSTHEQKLFTVQINSINLGYAENFCTAISKATEDILFLCDQDDSWEPEKVDRLLKLLTHHNVDMAFSDGLLIDSHGHNLSRTTVLESYGLTKKQIANFHENAFDALLKRNYINGAAVAIRRTSAQKALPLPCEMPHDYWLGIWCALQGGIVATPEPLYHYRQHADNAIGIGASSHFRFFLNLWRYCDQPRERELRIWQAVTERISSNSCKSKVDSAVNKLNWLKLLVPPKKASWKRLYHILESVFNGSYQHFSPNYAALRDLFSLINALTYGSK